ncbi:MAG: hypothetical protein ABII01_01320 [Candidatus Woesearchaeota archaeon]
MADIRPKADFLLEVSWEVCNKVGGIYTVITSKLDQIRNYYGENYLLIGPYFPEKVHGIFQEELPLDDMKAVFKELKKENILCHLGTWLENTNPKIILVDFAGAFDKINELKRQLWDDYKIDSLRAGHDYNEPLIWGYCVGRLLDKLSSTIMKNKKVVAHFHEWLAGFPLLMIKKNNLNIATVFTTHATILGRTLASNNFDLYCQPHDKKYSLEQLDPLKEAYNHSIEAKYGVETACANNADIFTTVSEITGIEASYLLKKKPDMILPNGLDMKKFPTFEEVSIKHRHGRNQIKEFLMTYFFPYDPFDLDNTLVYFLAGRYEFRDKGIDIFIKALGLLNDRLKAEKSKSNIVAFLWVPAGVRGIKSFLLENRTLYNDIKDSIKDEIENIEKKLIYALISNKEINNKTLFEKDLLNSLRAKIGKFKKKGDPPLCTHDLQDENDQIIKMLTEVGLDNRKDDKVKIVYYPIYLTGADQLLDLDYYEAMNGSHLGVFPSYYEPWGYTPLEAGALGVSSVTTDLAGFGRFIEGKKENKNTGIFVLERLNRNDNEITKSLADFMYWFQILDKYDRVQNKIEARRLASLADWELLIKKYIESHNLAVKRKF